jgi:ABC-type transport system substrate-binding protein/class 3 adenylate cyclase
VPDDSGQLPKPTDVRSFLIADIRGYTTFTQVHGDEAGARLAGRFAQVVREEVEGRGGAVVELRGDEALCAFGSPRGALRAAVALQRRCADEIRADPSLPLRVGIGMDAGEAVAVEGGYRGGALNLAARLCSIAKAGEVLVTEGIVHLARRVDDLTYADRGRMTLKGIAEPVRVMQVEFALDLPSESSVAARRRLTLMQMVALAVAAVTLLAAAVFAGTRGGHSSPALVANAVASLDSSGSVSSQVSLPGGGRPAGIAAGGGGIWATDAVRTVAVEVNPTSGALEAATPPLGTAPSGIAVGGGGLWVADSAGATVRWVSLAAPTTPPTSISVGQGPGPIAYGDGAAWVVNAIDGTLQRLRGPGERPSVAIPVGADPTAVIVAAGSVWVADAGSKSVERLDPGLRVTDRIPVGSDPVALAYGGGAVWVANTADATVTRIEPSNDSTRTTTVGGQPVGVAFAGGSVWVAVDHPSSVAQIEPGTLSVRSTALASPPQAIVGWEGRPWITSLASAASHRGGTLRVLFGTPGGNPRGSSPFGAGLNPYDPGAAPYGVHFSLLHLTNDGLVALRRIGGAGGEQLVPDLAVAPPAISDGGRTYTFRLRRGIRYSNGDPVKPSDFQFAIRRMFLNPTVSYGTSFFGDIVGASECTRSPPECRTALGRGIQPDDVAGTVTIHLVHPDPGFVFALATTFADLLPHDTPAIDSGRPVPATGPYMIAKAGEDAVTLVRNPRFRQWSAAAQPAGFPNSIQWTYARDGAALTDVEKGRDDVMLNDLPAGRLAELRTTYAALAHPYVGLETDYVSFNTHVPPFSSKRARQAVNFAIDRRRLAAFAGVGKNTPTCQVLPPTMFGYSPYCPYTRAPNPHSGAWLGNDPSRARALIAQSGTRGDRVEVWACTCLGTSRSKAAYVGQALAKLGYRVSNRFTSDYNQYVRGTSTTAHPVVIIEQWTADFPYPSNYFDALLLCSSHPEPAIRYCDNHLDALVSAAKRASGNAGRMAWQRADRATVDQAAWAPLTNDGGIDVIGRRVGNYQHNPQIGILLDQLWVR